MNRTYIMGTFAAGPECDDELPGSVVDLMRGFVIWKHYNTNLDGLRKGSNFYRLSGGYRD